MKINWYFQEKVNWYFYTQAHIKLPKNHHNHPHMNLLKHELLYASQREAM